MILIKSDKIFAGLVENSFHSILVEMTLDACKLFHRISFIPVITSAYRENDSGVHGYYRGIDFRSRSMSQSSIFDICEKINNRYQYDPDRPEKECLIYHDTGRGPHLHLQSHPNTKRR